MCGVCGGLQRPLAPGHWRCVCGGDTAVCSFMCHVCGRPQDDEDVAAFSAKEAFAGASSSCSAGAGGAGGAAAGAGSSVAAAEASVASSDGTATWQCTNCTFDNSALLQTCEMCDRARGPPPSATVPPSAPLPPPSAPLLPPSAPLPPPAGSPPKEGPLHAVDFTSGAGAGVGAGAGAGAWAGPHAAVGASTAAAFDPSLLPAGDLWVCGFCRAVNQLTTASACSACSRLIPETRPGKDETTTLKELLRQAQSEVRELLPVVSKLQNELSVNFVLSTDKLESIKAHAEARCKEMEARTAAEVATAKEKAEAEMRAARASDRLALLPGEKEFMLKHAKKELAADAMFRATLQRSRRLGAEDVAHQHFAQVEAAFLRHHISGNASVVNVEYVVNPVLRQKFEAKRHEYGAAGRPTGHVLCFHGTAGTSIDPILKSNFRMPAANYGGTYGAGIYFSEQAAKALSYAKSKGAVQPDRTIKLLCCQVLLGKSFVTGPCRGPCKPGHDSHQSTNGIELVVFSPDCVNPAYVLTIAEKAATIEIGK